MPTTDQLELIIASQLEFFAGSGLPKQNYEGNSEGYGLTQEKNNEIPLNARGSCFNYSGKSLGFLVVNPETEDIEIKVH